MSKYALILIVVVVVLIMLVAGIGAAYAFSTLGQARSTSSSTPVASVPGLSPTTTTHHGDGQHHILGVVQSLGNQSFVIATTKGKHTITVTVDATTTFSHSGKTASFSDLHVGDTVSVTGNYNATNKSVQATRIVIAPKTKTPTPTPTVSPVATPSVTATP